MLRLRSRMTLVLITLFGFSSVAAADIILLNANFEDKPVDQPIGTGGPTVGEPVYVGPQIIATVRNTPLPTACLEVADNDDYSAGYVGFEFLETGTTAFAAVTISATLWFTEDGMGDYYTFGVVADGESVSRPHASVFFVNGSRIHISDTTGYDTDIGTFSVGKAIPLLMELDLVAGNYDLWVDGVMILGNRPHAFTEQGINLLTVSCGHDPDLSGAIYVDDLIVVATLPPVAIEGATWSRVKALYR